MNNLNASSPLIDILDNLITTIENKKSMTESDISYTLDAMRTITKGVREHNQAFAPRLLPKHTAPTAEEKKSNKIHLAEDLDWILRLFRALPIAPDGINDEDEATASDKTIYFTTTKPRKKKSQ